MTPRTPRKVWFTQVGKDIVPNPQPCTEHDTEYHRADLSRDLVRAALERAASDADQYGEQSYAAKMISASIRAMAKDDEAVEAIIASVLGEQT